MADLRIVDAPLLSTVKGTEKIPTGGEGNFSVSVNQVADFAKLKWFLATEEYVDNAVGNVQADLNLHKNNSNNPHQVTKVQVGLGNVDNTADLDKPVSDATRSAIITANSGKADKSYVDNQLTLKADKAGVYTKQESSDLVNNSISTALTPVNTSLDLAKRGIVNRYDSSLTYNSGERVVLTNGDIVKSTIDENTNNPNVDMTGWVDTLDASFVVDGNESQHQLNTEFKKSYHIESHSIADVQALNEPTGTKLTLHSGRRSGEFTIRDSADQITLDKTRTDAPLFTLEQAADLDVFNAVFIQTENGVAVRDIGYSVEAGWFGVTYDWNHETQTGTDDTEKLRAAMYFAAAWKLPLSTDSGAIRTTSQLVSQKDGYWKALTWESNNTEVIADHAGSGMRFYGGAYKFTQRGNLAFSKSNAFKTTGGNSFPDLTDLVTYSATKNYGVVFDGNQHDVENITASGFNAGVIFYIGEFNMNYSKHSVRVTGNDLGVLVFGPYDDASVIETEITAFENFQEGVYVKSGVNFRQWTGRIRAENNLKDRITNPAIAGRWAVYIGHHIACDLWCYVEQYESLTPGTFELYVSDTGSSTIFSARKNTDYIRGNNTAQSGNTLYQHFHVGNPATRQATPLRLQGFGVRFNDSNDFVEMPIVADDTKYGSVRGQAGRIGLHSQNSTQSITVSDNNVRLGKSFNGIFTDEVALSSASPTFSQLIKTLYLSNEASIGTLTVIGSSNDPTYGYIPYILKVDFYINGGVVTLNTASRMYFNNSEGKSSANIRQDGSNVYLDLTYDSAWHGSNYYFKYKLELISAIR